MPRSDGEYIGDQAEHKGKDDVDHVQNAGWYEAGNYQKGDDGQAIRQERKQKADDQALGLIPVNGKRVD